MLRYTHRIQNCGKERKREVYQRMHARRKASSVTSVQGCPTGIETSQDPTESKSTNTCCHQVAETSGDGHAYSRSLSLARVIKIFEPMNSRAPRWRQCHSTKTYSCHCSVLAICNFALYHTAREWDYENYFRLSLSFKKAFVNANVK